MIRYLNALGSSASQAGALMLLQSAVLILMLVVIELTCGRRWRAALRCALWLLVIVKLLLPPTLKLPTGLGFWLGRWIADPVPAVAPAEVTFRSEIDLSLASLSTVEPKSPPSQPRPQLDWRGRLILVWFAGSLALTGWIIRRSREIRGLVRHADPAPPEFEVTLRNLASQVGLRRIPELCFTRINHSPAVCGFLRPVIILPAKLAQCLTADALRDVLLHELVHLQRRDLWLNLPQAVAQVIWWWNPCVWLANARIRALREQAVDESVMLLRGNERTTYPTTLVEVARLCATRPALALSFVGILESHRTLRNRVERLLSSPLPCQAGLGRSGWFAIGLAALVALPMAFNRRVEAQAEQGLSSTPSIIAAATGSGSGSEWRPWSEAAVARVQAEGRIALVDFTAKWCVTCRVNRKDVLESPNVARRLQQLGVVKFVADGTLANPELTAKLEELGRSSVPAVVVYLPHADLPGMVLPETLSEEVVLGTLDTVQSLNAALATSPVLSANVREKTPTNAVSALYRMDPELLRRYGLVAANPGTNSSLNAPSFARVDPALARRYGLTSPADTNANPPPVAALRMDPELARRYGLLPPAPTNAPVTNAPSFYQMDPVLARRYGLIPPTTTDSPSNAAPSAPRTDPRRYGQMPTPRTKSSATNAPNFYQMDPVLARRYGLIPPNAPTATNASSANPANPESPAELFTRTYRVEPNTFVQGIEAVTGQTFPGRSATGTRTNLSAEIQSQVRDFIRACGVDLKQPSEKAVFFNDRTGILFVRATHADLAIIEKAIETLNVAPPQVLLEAQFLELDSASLDVFESESFNLKLVDPTSPAGPGGQTFNAILNASQLRNLLQRLDSNPGVHVLALPNVITLSGRAAQVSIADRVLSVTDPTTGVVKEVAVGPWLEINPKVMPDDQSFTLAVTARLTRFFGYSTTQPPEPQFSETEISTQSLVGEGQTLVLGNFMGANPELDPANRQTFLLVLITPTVVDPAGRPVNHAVTPPKK